jgi:RNA polymerase sigma-70 factor (ECF subfamily)
MIDINLNNKLKQGNPEAYTLLFRKVNQRLLGYCQLFVSDTKKCEDFIQDCFEYLWTNKEKIDPSKSVESMLFVMVRNKCLNHLKNEKTHQKISLSEESNINELQFLYQLDFTDKEDITLEEQLIVSLKKAIDELPEKRKQIFIKCKIEGRKQKDVAEEMQLSVRAVEKHINIAKTQLRQQLEKDYTKLSFIIFLLLK